MRFHLALDKIRKIILLSFIFYSFLGTTFCQKKIENLAIYMIKKALPNSELKGLYAKSLLSWHIDTLHLQSEEMGILDIYELDFSLDLKSLFLLKPYFDQIYARKITLLSDENTPVSFSIFSTLYEKKPFVIKNLNIELLELSLFKEMLSCQFTKKPKKLFLDLYSQDRKMHAHLEIGRSSPFLKFTGLIDGFNPVLGSFSTEIQGFIKNFFFLEYHGIFEPPFISENIHIKGSFNDQYGLVTQGVLSSDNSHSTFSIKNSHLNFQTTITQLNALFPKSPCFGSITAECSGPLSGLNLHLTSNDFHLVRKQLAPLKLDFLVDATKTTLKGSGCLMQNLTSQLCLDLSSRIIENQKQIHLSLKGEPITFKGGLDFESLNRFLLHGEGHCQDLSFFKNFFENTPLKGTCVFQFQLDPQKKIFDVFTALKNIQFKNYFLEKGSINLISQEDRGKIDLQLSKFTTPFYEAIDLSLTGDKKQSWELIVESKFKNGDLKLSSNLQLNKHRIYFECLDAIAHVKNDLVQLKKPFHFMMDSHQIKLNEVAFSGGDFNFFSKIDIDDNVKKIDLDIQNLPLEGIKIPTLDTSFIGLCNLNCHLDQADEKNSNVHFHAKKVFPHSSILSLAPFDLVTNIHFHNHKAFYQTTMSFITKDLLTLNGTLNHDLNQAFNIKKLFDHTHHELYAKFDLKDIGHFTDIGSNTIGGKFFVSTLIKKEKGPFACYGLMNVTDIYAGFPLIGLYTQNGKFDMKFNGLEAEFDLQTFDLLHGKGGALGKLYFNDLSYQANVLFNELFIKFKDVFSTDISGICSVRGSFKDIYAEGKLELSDPEYNLIHKDMAFKKNYVIEKQFQDLPQTQKEPFSYQLKFDLKTKTDVRIQGAGLDSYWKGDSICEIGNKHFALNGSLKLEKGEYRFNSKRFMIDEGHIALTQNTSSIVSKAHLDIGSHQIKINLQGPLTAPSLTLSSLPYLAQNSIMSYILFNKPISELNPYQSVELAQTLMDFSGEKLPFSLSQIRHTLSMDSLEITTSDSEKSPLVLKVGKYIRPGVLVALTQGVKSSDMLIQLELKHGFILKAESQEQKEGKFSLKWTKNF